MAIIVYNNGDSERAEEPRLNYRGECSCGATKVYNGTVASVTKASNEWALRSHIKVDDDSEPRKRHKPEIEGGFYDDADNEIADLESFFNEGMKQIIGTKRDVFEVLGFEDWTKAQ